MKHLRNRRLWCLILGAMLVPLAFVAFWPSPVDAPIQGTLSNALSFLHYIGIPHWFNYRLIEPSANVLLFIPLGFVSYLSFQEKQWWRVGAFGLTISGCIELGQLLFLHNRFASPVDLMTNTTGAVLGALAASAAITKAEARHLSATDL